MVEASQGFARPVASAVLCGLLLVGGAASAYEPRTNFALQCMGCHTADGSGEPGRVPSLRDTLVPFAALAEGRRYLVQVPGVSQSSLTDAETAVLLNWMIAHLSNAPVPADFKPFTAAEVAGYRRTPQVDVAAKRRQLLESLER
jgi:hypothetical protein